MSAVCILAPVVMASWPGFSAAVTAAAVSLGYTAAVEVQENRVSGTNATARVNLEMNNSEIVTSQLGRDQRISVSRSGVTVTFSRDARGKAGLCVTGTGYTSETLEAIGQELSQRVVQKYVYQRLMDEMRERQYMVVSQEVDENQAIHMRIRHWEN
jgi:hypothetical protein